MRIESSSIIPQITNNEVYIRKKAGRTVPSILRYIFHGLLDFVIFRFGGASERGNGSLILNLRFNESTSTLSLSIQSTPKCHSDRPSLLAPNAPGAVPHHCGIHEKGYLVLGFGSHYYAARPTEGLIPDCILLHTPLAASRTRRKSFDVRLDSG